MRLLLTLVLFLGSNLLMTPKAHAAKPRLVVNIIVSQLRANVLESMRGEFSEQGFVNFLDNGVVCTEARYEFMQTTTLPTLSTLATGTNPSTHGITSKSWVERTTNQITSLTQDRTAVGLDCEYGKGQLSAKNLVVPTLGDCMKAQNPKSKVVSIALEPNSAIVLGGARGENYWMDLSRGTWISSTAFMDELPIWVKDYNAQRTAKNFINYNWKLKEQLKNPKKFLPDYSLVPTQAAGNTIVSDFAKQAVIYNSLGSDDNTDLLYINYDVPRHMTNRWGYDNELTHEMMLRLDEDIEDLISFITAQVGDVNVLFVLTSDHGSSGEYKEENHYGGLFNGDTYKMLAHSFLSSQYGSGDWVVDYHENQLFLNHSLIYNNKIDMAELQERLATFTLQFRGVASVQTASALQSNYFGGGYAQLIQNGFYPKRSGDLIISLQPEWIEEKPQQILSSGSGYNYDRHVPLIFMGSSLKKTKLEQKIDMTDLAPTLAYIMQVKTLTVAEGEIITQITEQFNK